MTEQPEVFTILRRNEKESDIIEPPPLSFVGKIVIYGTSITQGGCVARPGMACSNILSRRLDAEFINLGFSGNGRGEPALAHLINQISGLAFIILDYEANANETIVNTLEPFVDILREEHPDIPILIMSKIRYADATDGSPAKKKLIENRDFQRTLVEKRSAAGNKTRQLFTWSLFDNLFKPAIPKKFFPLTVSPCCHNNAY